MKAQRLQLNCSPNRSRLHHQVTPKQKQPTFQTHRPSNRRAIVTLAKKMQSEIVANILDNTEVQHDLVEEAIAWASQHGLVYGAGLTDPAVALVHAPVSLTPMPYPTETFLLAKKAATAFNTLIDTVSRDDTYLTETLTPAAQYDGFTANLLKIHAATAGVRAARRGTPADASLAVTRSDYMLHEPTSSLLQVELNTIASSFGCLSTLVGRLHRHLLGLAGASESVLSSLPANSAIDDIADALGAACTAHGAKDGVVLMVVQPGERNAYDQRWLQLRLWERHGIRTVRRTLTDIAARGHIRGGNESLEIDGRAVSVVYFRAGYTPNDYFGDQEWSAREVIERSDAIKCPTIGMQLAGAKKIQQDLAAPGVVERFAASPEEAALMRSFFADQWSFENLQAPHTAAAITDAIEHPENYVLKPQREGGGNNLYGAAMAERLASGQDLGALILMQRIHPPVQPALMLRLGSSNKVDTLSELGVYGTFLRVGEEVVLNQEAGHLVRTKAASSDEGGVAAGFAVLDSPILV